MKKILNRILPPVMIAAMLVSVMSISAFAELVPAANNWSVSFTTDKKMVSTFKTAEMDDQIYGLQPGDYTDITLNLKNDNETTTDWYMTNQVLKSLEDTRDSDTGLAGGAYTYILTYKGNQAGSEERVLFSSETVGGENVSQAGEGLHEATDALKDWIYLDTLKKGEGGTLNLRVALDGETQGNDYQDTLAELQMNFAVELNTTPNTPPKEDDKKKETKDDDDDDDDKKKSSTSSSSSSSHSSSSVVKTGDYTDTIRYIVAAAVSGVVLFFLALYSYLERRRLARRKARRAARREARRQERGGMS